MALTNKSLGLIPLFGKCFFFKKKKNQLIYLFTYLLNYLFLAALGLCCCSGCGVRASHFGGFSCFGAQALEHGLSSCGAGLVALRPVGSSQNRDGTCVSFFPEQGWSPRLLLPRTRMEPVSPALAGGSVTTGPPGKPWKMLLLNSGFV